MSKPKQFDKERSSNRRSSHDQERESQRTKQGGSQWAQQYEEGRHKMRVNLNEASEEDLEKFTGIGRERARVLIEHRPFHSWEDVQKVPGFSEGMLEDLKKSGASFGKPEEQEPLGEL